MPRPDRIEMESVQELADQPFGDLLSLSTTLKKTQRESARAQLPND
jgi:hypothetical protein